MRCAINERNDYVQIKLYEGFIAIIRMEEITRKGSDIHSHS